MVFPICDVKGKPILGMFRSASHSILEIDDCLLCNASISKVMQITRKWLKNSIFKGFNFNKKSGDLMYLVVREHSNQILVTIVASREVELKSLYDCYIQSFDNIGLSLIISDLSGDILSGKYIHLYGKENININEFGVSYCIDSRGFLQVNNEIKNKLYQEVLDNIDIDASVIDAYSGAGLLSAIIAKKAKEVVAIEINKSASNSAKQLFLNNNIDNIKNICADVGAVLLKELKLMDNITIVLDPPRSGCSKEVFDSINRMSDCNKINKIIYISCNPSTLARDLSILKERYIIDSVRPYNMFPRTKHIETLVCLQRQV